MRTFTAILLVFTGSVPAWAQIDPRSMGAASSRIMHGMTFGPGGSSGGATPLPAPIAPGCNRPPNNVVVVNPGFGWGWGSYGGYGNWGYNPYWNYSNYGYGYGSSYQQGYYLGTLERENWYLRQQLEQRRLQLEQEAIERQQAQQNGKDRPDQIQVPPKSSQRERVERNRAETALKSGMRQFQRGSYTQAAQKFEQAKGLSNASSLFLAGQAYIAAGQYDRALNAIKDGLAENPGWPAAEVDLTTLYTDPDELAAQMGKLARELKQQPNNADLMFLLAFELFGTGEIDKARTLIEQAARLSADDDYLKPFFEFYAADAPAKPAQDKVEHPPAEGVPVPEILEHRLKTARQS